MRIVLLTLLACDTEPDDSGGDTSSPGAPACIVSDEDVESIDVSVTAMPTVLQATWSIAGGPSARVRFVDSTGRWVENAPDDGLMVGLLPSNDVEWQLVWEADGETRCSSVSSAATGPLDAPSVPVEGALAAGYLVVPVIAGRDSTPASPATPGGPRSPRPRSPATPSSTTSSRSASPTGRCTGPTGRSATRSSRAGPSLAAEWQRRGSPATTATSPTRARSSAKGTSSASAATPRSPPSALTPTTPGE